MLKYPRVGITVKTDLDQKDAVIDEILTILRKAGARICPDLDRMGKMKGKDIEPFTALKDIDLLIVLGGDGTILRTVRELENFSVPILAINLGVVGFMAEMSIEEAAVLLPRFLRGEGVIDERSVLRVKAMRNKKKLFEGCVLNEAVISQGSIARLMDLRTTVNDEELRKQLRNAGPHQAAQYSWKRTVDLFLGILPVHA